MRESRYRLLRDGAVTCRRCGATTLHTECFIPQPEFIGSVVLSGDGTGTALPEVPPLTDAKARMQWLELLEAWLHSGGMSREDIDRLTADTERFIEAEASTGAATPPSLDRELAAIYLAAAMKECGYTATEKDAAAILDYIEADTGARLSSESRPASDSGEPPA